MNRAMTRDLHRSGFEMGKAFTQFANELLEPRTPTGDPKKKFIEFFAVPTSRALVPTQK